MKKYEIFRYGILRRLRRGIDITIYLTFKCQLDCEYCVAKKPTGRFLLEIKEKSIKELKKFVAEIEMCLSPFRLREIRVSGGGPEMHPDFAKFVNWLLNQGYFVQVYTNLMNFRKLNLLKPTCRLMICSTFHHSSNKMRFINNYYTLKEKYRIKVDEIIENPEDKQLNFSKGKDFCTIQDMKDNRLMLRVAPNLKAFTNCYDIYDIKKYK
ncbi:MAG: hypothetical protein ACFFC1_15030 [Promethearchaeota archaeon]